jgi:two-component system, chemotaxis family, sensor kinase CheA
VTSGPFFDQFLDEYFAECEEHMAKLRHALLGFESGARPRGGEDLREVARALHTLKGLSGMVGYIEVERVAHALEDRLRSTGGAAPRGATLDALFRGTTLLERCLVARRAGDLLPDVDAGIDDVAAGMSATPALTPQPGGAAGAGGVGGGGGAAGGGDPAGAPDATGATGVAVPAGPVVQAGEQVLEFRFTPDRQLAERGVGVDTVRVRLAAAGHVVRTTPRVLPGGGVAFHFVVVTDESFQPPDEWRADGIDWQSAGGTDRSAAALASLSSAAASAPSTNVVRIELARLDELMRLVGELVISRARLDDTLRRGSGGTVGNGAAAAWDAVAEVNGEMERQLRDLREAVMRTRLVPVGEPFERMRFAVREVAHDLNKQVETRLEGAATEIDKLVVERMHEPLLHLVRNAVSHGIEPAAERVAAGKPAAGLVTLRAAAAGERILIDVEDDGRGIDPDSVREHARAQGLIGEDASGAVSLLDLLCTSGFSTRAGADLASGRGIGMAVVRSTVHALGGELHVESEHGRGTRFRIELPLTLMIVDALLVDVAGQLMAVPQPALQEVLQIDPAGITRFENNEVLSYRGGVLPLVRLADVFGLPAGPRPAAFVLVVGSGAQSLGLLVDRLAGLREIVVRAMADPLVAVAGIAGATELSDGRVVLILDTGAFVRRARGRAAATEYQFTAEA